MRILPNQVFLHEEERFEPDTVYEVEDAQGFYFCAVGWAEAVDSDYVPTGEPQTETVDLDVQNASLGILGDHG